MKLGTGKRFSVEEIKRLASGRELDILQSVAGVPAAIIEQDKREHPCPKCSDSIDSTRCRLIDRNTGAIFCSHCFDKNNGDFLAAIQHFRGVDLPEALRLVADYLGLAASACGARSSGKPDSRSLAPQADAANIPWKTVKTWVYTDQAGKPLYRVKRIEWTKNGEPKKSFIQERYIGGKWVVGLGNTSPVPFNWSELNRRAEEKVFIVEGEKCCDALTALGFLATTASGGSNTKIDWAKFIDHRDVVILPDNDKPGFEYALRVADQLYGSGCEIKVVFLSGLKHKGDVADWVLAHEPGPVVPELTRIVEETPRWNGERFSFNGEEESESSAEPNDSVPEQRIGPVLVSFDEIEETEVSWLLQDVFPMGMVSVLAGKPGQGKSFLTCWLSSVVSGDDTVYFRHRPIQKGSVIICNAEDDAGKVIKKRLRTNGANLSRVKTISYVLIAGRGSGGKSEVFESPITLEMIDAFEQAFIETPDCRLLIVDPVSAFWGDTNDQKNAEVRVVVAKLKRLAEKYNIAVVLVTHLNKSASSDSSTRITGSGGLPAAGRANWLLSQDESGLRTISLIKTNVSESKAGFTFRIEDGRVRIIDHEIAVSADEILQAELDSRQGVKGRKPERQDDAEEWLADFLQDGRKPAGSGTAPAIGSVRYESERIGHSWGTIRRAGERLGVVHQRNLNVWFWELPRHGIQDAQNVPSYTPVHSAHLEPPVNTSTSKPRSSRCAELEGIGNSEQLDLLADSEPPAAPGSDGPIVHDFDDYMNRRREVNP